MLWAAIRMKWKIMGWRQNASDSKRQRANSGPWRVLKLVVLFVLKVSSDHERNKRRRWWCVTCSHHLKPSWTKHFSSLFPAEMCHLFHQSFPWSLKDHDYKKCLRQNIFLFCFFSCKIPHFVFIALNVFENPWFDFLVCSRIAQKEFFSSWGWLKMSHLYFLTRCSKTVHACLLSKCLYEWEVLSCPLSLEARFVMSVTCTRRQWMKSCSARTSGTEAPSQPRSRWPDGL